MTKAEALFARHHRDVLRYLAHMTGRPDVAEDLAQEVFVKVVRTLENGGSVGHERGWVFTIARSVLADRRSDDGRHAAVIGGHEPFTDGGQSLAHDLRQAFGQLPPADREMFLLREVGGLTYQEIADACQCTVEGVRSRLHRARIALRTILAR
jgi:RNA polymerase sigma-70 factor, ECF subfamily